MSAYPDAPAHSASATSARPATLMAALGAAVVAALAAIVNGVMVMADTVGVLIEVAAEKTGIPVAEVEATLGGSEALRAAAKESEDYQILRTRAIAVLVCGLGLLVFGLLMRKAALWARILVTIFAVVTAGFSLLIAAKPDEGTSLMIILGWVAVILAVVALVAAWLPANGRYAKAAR